MIRDRLLDYRDRMDAPLLDDVRLLTSELVTNAVTHSGQPAGDPISVTVDIRTFTIHVEVSNRGHGPRVLTARCLDPPSGLQVVEKISDRWSSHASDSFHVWFEIDIKRNHLCHRKNALA